MPTWRRSAGRPTIRGRPIPWRSGPMPHPRLTAPERFWSGWFDVVPAYRLATLRLLLAVITLVFHVPKFNRMIADYTASSFHVPPAFSWIPVLSPAGGMALMLAQDVAAWGLLLG